jgi:hypothetical protein
MATIYLEEKGRLVFFDYGKTESMVKRVSYFGDDMFWVIVDDNAKIVAERTRPYRIAK